MAAGDITRDTGSPTIVGNRRLLTGTIEVDDTFRGFQLCNTSSYIFNVNYVGEDGLSVVEATVNTTDSSGTSATQNGSVRVRGNDPTARTVRYACTFI